MLLILLIADGTVRKSEYFPFSFQGDFDLRKRASVLRFIHPTDTIAIEIDGRLVEIV